MRICICPSPCDKHYKILYEFGVMKSWPQKEYIRLMMHPLGSSNNIDNNLKKLFESNMKTLSQTM
jgi:hypothetical protein